METDLKFRPFRSPADPGWDEAWAIYQNSFPQKEIRSLEDHLQALSDPHYTADGIWSDGRLIQTAPSMHIPYGVRTSLGVLLGRSNSSRHS